MIRPVTEIVADIRAAIREAEPSRTFIRFSFIEEHVGETGKEFDFDAEELRAVLDDWEANAAVIISMAVREARGQAITGTAVEAEREACASAVEQRAVELGRQECCGFGQQGSAGSPPECCADPLYMISNVEAASAIRARSSAPPVPAPIDEDATLRTKLTMAREALEAVKPFLDAQSDRSDRQHVRVRAFELSLQIGTALKDTAP